MTEHSRRQLVKRIVIAALSLGIVVATFAYFRPTIANYGAVGRLVAAFTRRRRLHSNLVVATS